MGRRSIEALRREELIAAGLQVVAVEGHDAATMQRIGAAADISPGVVHHYFGDKQALMLAVMRAVRKPVAAVYREKLVQAGTDRDRLQAVLDAHLDPQILTVPRAAAWVQFAARVAYVPDYGRIHLAVRCRQVAALRQALLPLARDHATVPDLAQRAALALDACWWEAATREGGLASGEGHGFLHAVLADSIW